jgi:UDP-GlcNAc:undecaprenyl-phosphate GlcNAc-1-phosphate transferase
LAWIAIPLAWRLDLVDHPGAELHKRHQQPTPLAGGPALMATLLLGGALLGQFADPELGAIYLGALLIFAFGLWDDFRALPPWLKFLGQLVAAIVVMSLGVRIGIFESPEFFLQVSPVVAQALDVSITLLWLVGLTNAFNFVDSMDGLNVGLGGIAAAFFMLVMLVGGQAALAQQSALILGATVGLYLFNAPPARLFMGDSGAQTLGFILAALAIAFIPTGANQSSSWFTPIMLLGVPIFDTTVVVIARLLRGEHIYYSGRDHTYHRLLGLGLQPLRAVLVMQIAALVLGCVAVISLTLPPLQANLVFVGALVVGTTAGIALEKAASQRDAV